MNRTSTRIERFDRHNCRIWGSESPLNFLNGSETHWKGVFGLISLRQRHMDLSSSQKLRPREPCFLIWLNSSSNRKFSQKTFLTQKVFHRLEHRDVMQKLCLIVSTNTSLLVGLVVGKHNQGQVHSFDLTPGVSLSLWCTHIRELEIFWASESYYWCSSKHNTQVVESIYQEVINLSLWLL